MNNTILEKQFDNAINRFEERIKELRLAKFRIWIDILRDLFRDWVSARKAKENAIYGELMQIEEIAKECEPCEQSAKLIARIHKAKGIIGVLCFCLLTLNVLQFSSHGLRGRPRDNQVRVVTRKGRDDVDG